MTDKAIDILQGGCIVAYPTETFYALGARFDMHGALEKLYKLKKRPQEKAMPVIIGEASLLPAIVSGKWLANIPPSARLLMDRFWPGPLTLLLPAKEGLSEYLTANTGMIGVRVPGESFALQLVQKAGFPITATSANISAMPPAANADMVRGYFGDEIDLLIDGGQLPECLPSTIVELSGNSIRIVRRGAIAEAVIRDVIISATD